MAYEMPFVINSSKKMIFLAWGGVPLTKKGVPLTNIGALQTNIRVMLTNIRALQTNIGVMLTNIGALQTSNGTILTSFLEVFGINYPFKASAPPTISRISPVIAA